MRRLSLLLGAGCTLVFLAYGVFFLVDWLAVEHKTETRTFAAVPTVHLDVDGGGAVRVVGDGGDRIRVDLRWREGVQRASVSARLDGDRLVVHTGCPALVNAFCIAGATVHVPKGTVVDGGGSSPIQVLDVAGPVDLGVSNGSVRIEGGRGDVEVRGDNGEVTVVGGQGPLRLSTDNGSITTDAVRADRVDARTDNGRIRLDLAIAPRSVVARADNGGITVLVPDDGQPYAVSARSDNGSVDTPVATTTDAARTIDAAADNGSISVRYRPS
ncbi:DUF4097 family beta strand repeat protein [Aquihabitans sp. G128]|uniref:DUF4097 family beta strand repeat-containing protein n=1 Tax=Aquihabitans sp. G128 TaxID=2849779 RepID=UPI001C234DB3|nr:DUF4097 family beta strand repeat-containing protein [Aquihabitans sp. G128]QXC62181.1 DUF4097 family beta strand repeat protein [Aquihabitans sp. G128]